MLLVLTGAGLLWMGWSGFNGGAAFSAHVIAGLAVLNTHVCAATSLLTWTTLDVFFFGKPSVIGAVQGMMTGLVVITPAAGILPHNPMPKLSNNTDTLVRSWIDRWKGSSQCCV